MRVGEGASNAASSAFAGGEKYGTDGIAGAFVAKGGTTDGGERVVATGTSTSKVVVEASASTTSKMAAMEGNRSSHQCFGSEDDDDVQWWSVGRQGKHHRFQKNVSVDPSYFTLQELGEFSDETCLQWSRCLLFHLGPLSCVLGDMANRSMESKVHDNVL